MNDRFKFRIPEFTNKGSFIGFQYVELGDEIECTLCGYNGEFEQCTGRKDKNGKLIYEGDILKDDKGLLYLVVFISQEYTTSFNLKRIEIPNYYPHITTWCGLGYKNRNNYEVIGNCYENKELLEDTECQK